MWANPIELAPGGPETERRRHDEPARDPQRPPRAAEQEEDGGGVRLAVRQLAVLLPAEGERGHAVHHDGQRRQRQVEQLHVAGGGVGELLQGSRPRFN